MENAIVFENFSKRFGSFTAVDNLNITVKSGEITGFVGKNGAGKSTTLRGLMNIIFPTTGSITVNGMDSVKDAKRLRKDISFMSSDVSFYDVTPLDIFEFCTKFERNPKEDFFLLAEYFELDLKKKISQLSLGNKKKVSIICTLLKRSSVLVFDEPTSGLDPLMQEKFFSKLLERKLEGATIFLSSHNLSEIEKYCDRAIIIKSGKIIDDIDMNALDRNRKQIVSYITSENESKKYTFEGDVNQLVKSLSSLDLKTLEIRPASIEEEFIKYYNDTTGGQK